MNETILSSFGTNIIEFRKELFYFILFYFILFLFFSFLITFFRSYILNKIIFILKREN